MVAKMTYGNEQRFFESLRKVPFLGSPGPEDPVGMDGIDVDGALHLVDHRVQARSFSYTSYGYAAPARPAPSPYPTRTVLWKDLLDPDMCGSCLRWIPDATGLVPRILTLAILHMESSTTLRNARKVNTRTSATALENRISTLRSNCERLSSYDRKSLSAPPTKRTVYSSGFAARTAQNEVAAERAFSASELEAIVTAFEELTDAHTKAIEDMTRMTRSDDARERVAKQVARAMVPTRFRERAITLDTTPVLVGVDKGLTGTDLCGTIAKTYALRSDAKRTVMVVPSFIHAFLVRELVPNSSARTLVLSAPAAGVSDEVLETAAGIWNPEGDGDLVCLSHALELAAELV